MKNKKTYAVAAILLSNVIWGALYPANKISLTFFTPLWYFAIRYSLAAMIFAPFFHNRGPRITLKDHLKIALESWIGLSLAIILGYYGLRLSRGVDAAVIASLGPLLLYCFSLLLLRERFRIQPLLGTLLALAGTIIIVTGSSLGSGNASGHSLAGAVLILASVVLDVLGTVFVKPYLAKYDAGRLAFYRFIYAVVPVLALALFLEPLPGIPRQAGVLVGLGFGLFAVLAGFPLYYYGLKRLEGERIGVLFYIDPAIGALASIVLLNEQPSRFFFAGLAMIAGGILLAEMHIRDRGLLHSWHHHRH